MAEPFLVGERQSLLEDGLLWRWSPPVNFWRRYREQLDLAANLRVVQHATVTRLFAIRAAEELARDLSARPAMSVDLRPEADEGS